MKPAVIAIQFIVLLFTTPLHANSCECTISSPIILDDALSVKRFADLVRSTCAENAMAIRLEKGLYIQTANISDESLSSIPKALRVISIGENLSINRTKLVEFPLFLSELSAVGDASAINPADIVIKNNHLLTAIHLHKYNCSTQHNLIVENNNSLQHLHIPSSILDIKHISVSDNKSLTSLSAMNFNSANSIDIVNNPKLEDIEFISASLSIHSHLRIENNSSPRQLLP